MPNESWEELAAIEPPLCDHPEVSTLKLRLLIEEKRWDEGIELANSLWDGTIGTAGMRIHSAYCLHELGRTIEARDLLLSASEHLGVEPTFHYNLACYAAVLGDYDEARVHLQAAFDLDGDLRKQAQNDPDLDSVRDLIEQLG